MKNKISLLLIGKNSYISKNLFFFLKKKIKVKKISYKKFKKQKLNNLNKYNYICNCSITKKYSSKSYKSKEDIDLYIIKKIKNLKLKFIFLSSRKVYKPSPNIKENSRIQPVDNYSKNKIITENKIKKIIPKKFIILRISNLIGQKKFKKNPKKVSNTFIDNYFNYIEKKKIVLYENHYKDFLSINQFNKIFFEILKNNLLGVYNVSLGKKVYISEILKALNKNKIYKNFKKKKLSNNDSFYLNNKKLLKKIKLKLKKKDLINFCYKI
tara:strand:- start:49 stop:852 length:804 start_codon:yes stop_codon:yes gene_type:complete